jgi:hypothetical protein
MNLSSFTQVPRLPDGVFAAAPLLALVGIAAVLAMPGCSDGRGGIPAKEWVYGVGSTPQISAPPWYRVTVCVSLYTKLGSEMKE